MAVGKGKKGTGARFPRPANDDEARAPGIRAEVQIPGNLPITQTEIEVFAFLLDDWDGVAVNDNWKEPK